MRTVIRFLPPPIANHFTASQSLCLTYTPRGYHVGPMKFAWHKLFVVLALVWVFAPGQLSAMESEAGHMLATPEYDFAAVAQQHDQAMTNMSAMSVMAECCDALMPGVCAVSGMAHCASGAGAIAVADNMLAAPSALVPSLPLREASLTALALASDPPPPRI